MKDKGTNEGFTTKVVISAKARIEIDGKVTEFDIDHVTVTIDFLDYMIQKIVGGIAQAARDGVGNGIKGKRSESTKV